MPRKSTILSLARVVLPLVIGAVVVVWLFNGPLALDDRVIEGANGPETKAGLVTLLGSLPWWVPVGVLGLTLVALGLQVVRVALLMSAMGRRPPVGVALRAYFVGLFYGNLIPAGQVGGDPVKAWVLAKGTGASVPVALAAVAVDRIAGLAVLALIALIALGIAVGDPRYGSLVWWMAGFVGIASLGLLLLVSGAARQWSGASWLVAKLGGGNGGRRTEFVDALRHLGARRGTLAMVAALSAMSQALLVCAAAVVGAGLGGLGLGLPDYFALVPPASFVSSVPGSTPGGWGVGEGAYVLIFGAMGVAAESAALVSVVPRLAVAACSIIGLPASVGLKRMEVKQD